MFILKAIKKKNLGMKIPLYVFFSDPVRVYIQFLHTVMLFLFAIRSQNVIRDYLHVLITLYIHDIGSITLLVLSWFRPIHVF